MIKFFIPFLLILISVSSFSQSIIKGCTTFTTDGDSALLLILDENQNQIIDKSKTIIKGDSFKICINECANSIAILHIKAEKEDDDSYCEFVLEQGNINLSFKDNKTYRHGTVLNERYQMYIDTCDYYFDLIRNLRKVDLDYYYTKEYNVLSDKLYSFLSNFIYKNIDNVIGKRVLRREISAFPENYLRTLIDSLNHLDIDSTINKRLQQAQKEVDAKKKMYNLRGSTILKTFLLDKNDSIVYFNNILSKANYTFLEFWASYCSSCIKEISSIKEKYRLVDSSFMQIVLVSIDQNLDNELKNVCLNLKIEQNQVNSIRKQFGINLLPFSIIFDKDGKVIAYNENLIHIYNKLKNK